jgi:tRNA 2-thiouridine synthesizing protein A
LFNAYYLFPACKHWALEVIFMGLEFREGRYVLDLRGYVCPYPQIMTLQALRKLRDGELLEVVVDNPASCENVPAAVRREGHEVLGVEKVGLGVWRIKVVKRGSK